MRLAFEDAEKLKTSGVSWESLTNRYKRGQ